MQLTVIVPVELKICGPIENHREFWTGASFASYSTKAFSSFSVLLQIPSLAQLASPAPNFLTSG